MAATARWVRTGDTEPMERAALGKLIASCPNHDLATLDTPAVEPAAAGEDVVPAVIAGEWQCEMPMDSAIVQAVLEEMSTDSLRVMLQEHGSLETRGMRSEVMGKLAALLLPNEEWCAERRARVRATAIELAHADALSAYEAAKAKAAADLAHTRREIAWFQPVRVVQAMNVYLDEMDVQEKACVALGGLVLDAEHRARVVRAGGIDAIIAALCAYAASDHLQEHACLALAHISDDDARACGMIARAGGLEAVANAMRRFDSKLRLQRWGCAVFAHVLAAEAVDNMEKMEVRFALELAEAIVEAEGVKLLLAALTNFPEDRAVQRECYGALAALAQHEEAQRKLIVSSGAIDAALVAISKHRVLPDVVAEACLLLSTLTAGDPDVKRALVEAEGVREVCLALAEHESEPWVQSQALTVLWVLMVDPAAIDPATGLVNGVHAYYRRVVENAGGHDLAEAARVRFSGNHPEPEESLLNASQLANQSTWAQMPSLSLRPPSPETGKDGDDTTMRLVIEERKDEQEQLNILLAKAKALDHPGIDDEGINTMQEFITSGRFTRTHYIDMWSKRIEGLGVTIVRVPKGDELPTLVEDSPEPFPQHDDASEASSTTEEMEEDTAENMYERDDAVVHAAEGVLQKLHEGHPDPTKPWTAPVPMVKPENTIYLWHDKELIDHSATSHLEQLNRVVSLDDEEATLRAKLAAAGRNVGSTEGYMRMSEEAPEPQSLTKRCTEMSAEDFEAAEEAAAAKIRQRLKEIEEERKILPPEKDVAEVIKGELPSANPEARPRSPSPTRKWKPPPPPPAPPDSESDLELDPESVPPGTDIAGDESSTGWEQDENRPATRSGIEHAVALTATETIDSHYPDASGRQSPSFYDEEGELMPGLDATKERWKHELELEMLLASAEYKDMLGSLIVTDKQQLAERIEAANRAGQAEGVAEVVSYIERAIVFKSEHPNRNFEDVDENFEFPHVEETEYDGEHDDNVQGDTTAVQGDDQASGTS